MALLQLPLDALHCLLSFLPLASLPSTALVCSALHAAIADEGLWRGLCQQQRLHARPYCTRTWRDLCRAFGPRGHGQLLPLIVYDDDERAWTAGSKASALLSCLTAQVQVTCFLPLCGSADNLVPLELAARLMGSILGCVFTFNPLDLQALAPGLYLWAREQPNTADTGSPNTIPICLLALGVQLPSRNLHIAQGILHMALRLSSCAVVCMEENGRFGALECLDVLLPPLLTPSPGATSVSCPDLIFATAGDTSDLPVEERHFAEPLFSVMARMRVVELSTLAMWVINFFGRIRSLWFPTQQRCCCGDSQCQARSWEAIMAHLCPLLKPYTPPWAKEAFTAITLTGDVYAAMVRAEVLVTNKVGLAHTVELWAEAFGRQVLAPFVESCLQGYSDAMDFELQNSAPPEEYHHLQPATASNHSVSSSPVTSDNSFSSSSSIASSAPSTTTASSSNTPFSLAANPPSRSHRPARLAVPLDVDQLVRWHNTFHFAALRRFACECDRFGVAHPLLNTTTALKVELSNRLRQLWRTNLEVSRFYCEEVFAICFSNFEQRYARAPTAMMQSSVVAEEKRPADDAMPTAADEHSTGAGALTDSRALRRFYACFHNIVEEYCMKAKGPRKYEILLNKGTALLSRVETAFRASPNGRLHPEDVAQACATLAQELHGIAAHGIQRHDAVRAEQQRQAAMYGKQLALHLEVKRLQRVLERHQQDCIGVAEWYEGRLAKMQCIGYADETGQSLLAWASTQRTLVATIAGELQVARHAAEEFDFSLRTEYTKPTPDL